jgi:uncharacterized protein YjaZ
LSGNANAITVEFAESGGQAALPTTDRQAIEAIASQAERDVRAILRQLPQDLTLEVRSASQVFMPGGATGGVAGPRRIAWVVDTTRDEGAAAIARATLRPFLFHELHHVVRGGSAAGTGAPASLIDNAINEGMATAFARDFGGAVQPWAEYPDEVSDWVKDVLSMPATDANVQMMFWHPDGRRWIGYKVGTYLVDKAMFASRRSSADLVQATTGEILKLAGYER